MSTQQNYSDFSNDTALHLYRALATLSGAQALFQANCDYESVDNSELGDANILFDLLRQQIDETINRIHDSTPVYALKTSNDEVAA